MYDLTESKLQYGTEGLQHEPRRPAVHAQYAIIISGPTVSVESF